ncbi:MAG: hypothetical protein U5L96_05150 [Owenweeksia sp.]|nr:hypothetical protein [Owenweeksia sp.]
MISSINDKNTGRTQLALQKLEELRVQKDSLQSLQNDRQLQELKTKYETEMTTRDNEILREQHSQQEVIIKHEKKLEKYFTPFLVY